MLIKREVKMNAPPRLPGTLGTVGVSGTFPPGKVFVYRCREDASRWPPGFEVLTAREVAKFSAGARMESRQRLRGSLK